MLLNKREKYWETVAVELFTENQSQKTALPERKYKETRLKYLPQLIGSRQNLVNV